MDIKKDSPLMAWIKALGDDSYITQWKDYGYHPPQLRTVIYEPSGTGKEATHILWSPMGVLADAFVQRHCKAPLYSMWVDRWMRVSPVGGPHLSFDEAWPLPWPIETWWKNWHADLPFKKVGDYMFEPQANFRQLADLLAVGAPWVSH